MKMNNLSIWESRSIKNLTSYPKRLFELRNRSEVRVLILLYVHLAFAAFLVLGLSVLTTYGVQAIARLETWSLVLLVLFLVLCIAIIFTIWRQPQNQHKVAFMVCVRNIIDPKYCALFLLYINFCEFFLKKKITLQLKLTSEQEECYNSLRCSFVITILLTLAVFLPFSNT